MGDLNGVLVWVGDLNGVFVVELASGPSGDTKMVVPACSWQLLGRYLVVLGGSWRLLGRGGVALGSSWLDRSIWVAICRGLVWPRANGPRGGGLD